MKFRAKKYKSRPFEGAFEIHDTPTPNLRSNFQSHLEFGDIFDSYIYIYIIGLGGLYTPI